MSGSVEDRSFRDFVTHLLPIGALGPDEPLDRISTHVRFRAEVGYGNPGREIVRVERRKEPVEIFVNRHVLAGIYGPLPEPFQELAYHRAARGDGATAAFFDLFNHRVNLLRYWILVRHRLWTSTACIRKSPLLQLALALAEGVVPRRDPEDSRDSTVTPTAALAVVAVLRPPNRSLRAIETVLRKFFSCPLRLFPFAGGWTRRRHDACSNLGSATCRLGVNSVLGTKIWDLGKGIELQLRCPDGAVFRSLLPNGSDHEKLRKLLLWVTRRQFDVHVLLTADQTLSEARLGTSADTYLGYSSALRATPAPFERGGLASTIARFIVRAEETVDADAA